MTEVSGEQKQLLDGFGVRAVWEAFQKCDPHNEANWSDVMGYVLDMILKSEDNNTVQSILDIDTTVNEVEAVLGWWKVDREKLPGVLSEMCRWLNLAGSPAKPFHHRVDELHRQVSRSEMLKYRLAPAATDERVKVTSVRKDENDLNIIHITYELPVPPMFIGIDFNVAQPEEEKQMQKKPYSAKAKREWVQSFRTLLDELVNEEENSKEAMESYRILDGLQVFSHAQNWTFAPIMKGGTRAIKAVVHQWLSLSRNEADSGRNRGKNRAEVRRNFMRGVPEDNLLLFECEMEMTNAQMMWCKEFRNLIATIMEEEEDAGEGLLPAYAIREYLFGPMILPKEAFPKAGFQSTDLGARPIEAAIRSWLEDSRNHSDGCTEDEQRDRRAEHIQELSEIELLEFAPENLELKSEVLKSLPPSSSTPAVPRPTTLPEWRASLYALLAEMVTEEDQGNLVLAKQEIYDRIYRHWLGNKWWVRQMTVNGRELQNVLFDWLGKSRALAKPGDGPLSMTQKRMYAMTMFDQEEVNAFAGNLKEVSDKKSWDIEEVRDWGRTDENWVKAFKLLLCDIAAAEEHEETRFTLDMIENVLNRFQEAVPWWRIRKSGISPSAQNRMHRWLAQSQPLDRNQSESAIVDIRQHALRKISPEDMLIWKPNLVNQRPRTEAVVSVGVPDTNPSFQEAAKDYAATDAMVMMALAVPKEMLAPDQNPSAAPDKSIEVGQAVEAKYNPCMEMFMFIHDEKISLVPDPSPLVRPTDSVLFLTAEEEEQRDRRDKQIRAYQTGCRTFGTCEICGGYAFDDEVGFTVCETADCNGQVFTDSQIVPPTPLEEKEYLEREVTKFKNAGGGIVGNVIGTVTGRMSSSTPNMPSEADLERSWVPEEAPSSIVAANIRRMQLETKQKETPLHGGELEELLRMRAVVNTWKEQQMKKAQQRAILANPRPSASQVAQVQKTVSEPSSPEVAKAKQTLDDLTEIKKTRALSNEELAEWRKAYDMYHRYIRTRRVLGLGAPGEPSKYVEVSSEVQAAYERYTNLVEAASKRTLSNLEMLDVQVQLEKLNLHNAKGWTQIAIPVFSPKKAQVS